LSTHAEQIGNQQNDVPEIRIAPRADAATLASRTAVYLALFAKTFAYFAAKVNLHKQSEMSLPLSAYYLRDEDRTRRNC